MREIGKKDDIAGFTRAGMSHMVMNHRCNSNVPLVFTEYMPVVESTPTNSRLRPSDCNGCRRLTCVPCASRQVF